MEFFNILHITDLHFGGESTYENGTDLKDANLSKKFVNEFSNSWESIFCKSVCRLNEQDKIDFIAFTGDLGLSSKIAKDERIHRMEQGLLFLITLCSKINLVLDNLIIAPGNHDVDRSDANDQFKDLRDLCQKYDIRNCAIDGIISKELSKGIMLFSINSCIGANEKISEFNMEYFTSQMTTLNSKEEFTAFVDNIDDEQYSYQKDLDISAIGDEQNDKILDFVNSNQVEDACIILMHHNPVPSRCIEIRPYASLIDGGRFINGLFDTGKKVFILHGHTHFESCMSSYFPDSNSRNYITTIGGAALNASSNSEATLMKFIFCDKDHLKTEVTEIRRNGSLFKHKLKFVVYDQRANIDLNLKWGQLEINKNYTFQELKEKLEFNGKDKDLMKKLILLNETNFSFKKTSRNFIDWKFTRIK